MSSNTLTPYVFLSGRCEEAIDFYHKAIGADVVFKMRYNESPDPIPPGMLQEGFESKIMHATVRIKGCTLMMSDGCDDRSKMHGFRLALSLSEESDAHATFDALAQGGTIEMPMSKTFWSPCFGMVTDRFGVEWMVTVPGPDQPV